MIPRINAKLPVNVAIRFKRLCALDLVIVFKDILTASFFKQLIELYQYFT